MSEKSEKFTYKIGGKTITLPPFSDIPAGVFRKVRSEKDDLFEFVFTSLEMVLGVDSEEMAVIDKAPLKDVAEMFGAWQETAGVTMGESEES